MDKYSCFEHLSAHETRGADYEVCWRRGRSGIAVISIHGGAIEPGTSEIADAIAGADHSFYTFKGVKKAGNRDLHITSTTFDEPCALEILRRSEIIISIHGCRGQEEVVHVGGLDSKLRRRIGAKLRMAGFEAPRGTWSFYPVSRTTARASQVCQACPGPRSGGLDPGAEDPRNPYRTETNLRGLDKRNICNRCGHAGGVQLEISKGLRARMLGSLSHGAGLRSGTFPGFIQAVREAIESITLDVSLLDPGDFPLKKTLFKG
ncbi:MAG: poly-gamma-glutamate hydrolase family protein [Syntrophobacteraceae bacterium]|jgi:phage replication-related protein YjqB (UPF0714/DUF867 family)